MSTYFLSHFTVFLQNGVLVFVDQCLHFFFRKERVRAQVVYLRLYARSFHLGCIYSISFNRIFISETFCSGQLVQAVIRLRVHDIVLDFDDLSVGRTDQGSGVVTVAEFFAWCTGCFFYQCLTVYGFGIHGYQGSHAVATMDVECLSYRAKAVSGIYVAAIFLVVTQTPAQFIFFSIFPVIRPKIIQIMDVSSLCANDFTKHTLLCHVQGIHFKPVVAAVFQNHTMLASGFRQVDEFPALFQVHGRRYFNGYVLTMFHGIFGNREVMVPVSCNVHQVDVIAFAECFVAFCT